MAIFGRGQEQRRLSDLPLEELELVVEQKRRIERARAFAQVDETQRFSPIAANPAAKPLGRRSKRSGFVNTFLLLVELAAAGALILVIIVLFANMELLNQEVALALRSQGEERAVQAGIVKPAHETDALVPSAVELPGSSFPPDGAGELPGSSFAPEAAPLSIGVDLERPPALPAPTPGPQSPTRIVIPAIGVDYPIVVGDGWEELKRGVGHRIGSANPGERGNMVLSGHNDVFGEVFRDLEALKDGDQVLVYAGGREFEYRVRAKRIVAPTELSVLNPTREPVVTLITCYPYRIDTHRLVVIAQLVQ